MSKLKLEPVQPNPRSEAALELATRIGRNVIAAIGRPAGFAKIVVVRLWDNTHRVNILTGGDPTSTVIADSFFVVVDEDGNVLESTPPLARRYGSQSAATQ
jgi:hypothetical protein